MDIKELNNVQYEQFKILSHAYNIRKNTTDIYDFVKLSTIIKKLRESEYFNKESAVVVIKSTEINKLFETDLLSYKVVLITLGRNKIPYRKFAYRPKEGGRQPVLYNIYQIFLDKSDCDILSNNLATI